jgi:hypothetical protein
VVVSRLFAASSPMIEAAQSRVIVCTDIALRAVRSVARFAGGGTGGYFIGQRGRDKGCALKKSELEVLCDFSGVVYTPMDAGDGWKFKLAREIDAAGIAIDFNKAVKP